MVLNWKTWTDKYWVQFYICSENVNTLVKQYNKDI